MIRNPLDDMPPGDPRRLAMENASLAILRVLSESDLSSSEQVAVLARLTAEHANRNRRPSRTEHP